MRRVKEVQDFPTRRSRSRTPSLPELKGGGDFTEWEFLHARPEADCAPLLDVNNVYVELAEPRVRRRDLPERDPRGPRRADPLRGVTRITARTSWTRTLVPCPIPSGDLTERSACGAMNALVLLEWDAEIPSSRSSTPTR